MKKSDPEPVKPETISGEPDIKTGNGFRFQEGVPENGPFCESLAALRRAFGMNQMKAAELVQVTDRTIRLWESGTVTPAEIVQKGALAALRHGRNPPSKRRLDALARNHHLHWEEHKGWMLRLTINVGSKIVGKRVKIRLRTFVLDDAKKRRELVIASYRTLGIKVNPRIQKPKR